MQCIWRAALVKPPPRYTISLQERARGLWRATPGDCTGGMMHEITLTGPWRVLPIGLDDDPTPFVAPDVADGDWLAVPDATHLQLHFFPHAPYWGDHLRRLNEQAWVYRRRIAPAEAPPAERYRLRFEGVDYYADVWLNGVYIGGHEGGFVPFTLDVTGVLRAGPHHRRENVLAVIVRAPWDPPAGGSSPVDHVRRGMVKGLYEHAEGVIPRT
ncbi:MAG: hypothetical protein M5R40_01345 [Anaerolineae bacterium]|nr:hypothetical protein [Anaerolineae bacterium]